MMRWRCHRYRSWLVDHADGVLDASQRQRLEQHLHSCQACRADLDALQNLPEALSASAVPDPGDAFWLQQRQTISRAIRNLPPPRSTWSLEWLRQALQFSPWRYPIAATVALVLALSVYRIAERQPGPDNGSIAAQLGALDTEVLVTLGDLAEAVTPGEDALSYNPQEDEVAFAALAVGDLVGTHTLSHVPEDTDLSDTELEGVDDLIGNVG